MPEHIAILRGGKNSGLLCNRCAHMYDISIVCNDCSVCTTLCYNCFASTYTPFIIQFNRCNVKCGSCRDKKIDKCLSIV